MKRTTGDGETMTPQHRGTRTFEDEQYTKVFMVCGEGAELRKCLICEQVFSRRDSYEHSKFPCHPVGSTAN
jgi:hypothetical protein